LNISHVDWDPPFSDKLYFVYLGQKMDSAEARKHYHKHRGNCNGTLNHISKISESVAAVKSLGEFEKLIEEHERLISKGLKLKTVKEDLFPDYWGTVKSLGAWGGDFVMATSSKDATTTRAYFQSKGLDTVFSMDELVLKESSATS
jgi:hypothetical protein